MARRFNQNAIKLAHHPSSKLVPIAISQEDRVQQRAAIDVLLSRDPLETVKAVIPYVRRYEMRHRRRDVEADQLLSTILHRVREAERDGRPYTELLFDEAVDCFEKHDKDMESLGSEPERTGNPLIDSLADLELGSIVPQSSDELEGGDEFEMYDDGLLSNESAAETLLEAAAKFGEIAKELAESKLTDSDAYVRDAACHLYCLCSGFPNEKMEEFLRDSRLSERLYAAAHSTEDYRRRTEHGEKLRNFVARAAQHDRVRHNLLAVECSGMCFSPKWYKDREVVAEEVYLRLLAYHDARNSVTDFLVTHYPNVIPYAVARLNEETLSDALIDLLTRFGSAAVPDLLNGLQKQETVEQASSALASIGAPSVKSLIKLGRQTAAHRPIVKQTLAKIGAPALTALLHEAAEDLVNQGCLSLEVREMCAFDEESVPFLLKRLPHETHHSAASLLLARIGSPAIPGLSKALDDPDSSSAATRALLLMGSDGISVLFKKFNLQERRALLESTFAGLSLVFELLDSAVRDERMITQHRPLLEEQCVEHTAGLLDWLDHLDVDDVCTHPLFGFIASSSNAQLDRLLVVSFRQKQSELLRQLLVALGTRTLMQTRLLLDASNDIAKAGEDIISKISSPDEFKFPWLASLLAGSGSRLKQSVIRLLVPMGLPQSRLLFERILASTENSDLKKLAIRGIGKLATDQQCSSLPVLQETVSDTDDHLSAEAAKVIGAIGKNAKDCVESLTARRKSAKRGSPLYRVLDEAVNSVSS